jgi:hypothetical protein
MVTLVGAGQDHALTPVLKRNGIMTKEKRPVPDVRITNQFRRGKAMVYDFFCKGETRLTVAIAPSEDSTDTFTAAAHARQTPELPDITEPGSTRGEALRAVGRAWAAKNGDIGFPTVDWELVGQALVAVRAIEAASGLGAIA